MPKAKAVTSLSGTLDTDMEDETLNQEADAFPTPDSNQENATRGKKKSGRGKPTSKKFTKTRTAKPTSDPIVPKKAAVQKRRGAGRPPLKEQINLQQAEDTEEVDEFASPENEDTAMDELVEPKQAVNQPAKRKAPQKKGTKHAEENAVQQVNAMVKDGEFEYTPTIVRQTKGIKKSAASNVQKGKVRKGQPTIEVKHDEKVIPETQVPMEIELTEPLSQVENEDQDDAIPQSVFRRTNNARSQSRQQHPLIVRRRGGSISEVEKDANDVETRRKLGEMTKKFESMEMKYRNLKEIGIKEAESNFVKLKAQTQTKTRAADELIASLKKELSTQKSLSENIRSLQSQIVSRDADLVKTQALADQLSNSLAEAQNENKALQAKLANSRNTSAAVESLDAKTPGSSLRGKTPMARTVMVGSAEAAHAAQVAQLKEDLYSDLTGLILRGVERGEESDIYDCIQTGKNGTLHFKLAIAKEDDTGYENTEFQYTPRLDDNRDRNLIALLPEYLTEEITFSRKNAAMFYGRVVETLMKKRPVEANE